MFGDLGKMFAIAQRLRKELPAMKEKLAATEFSADAGDGAVRVIVNGKLQIVEVKIAPEACADGDAEALADALKAAIAAAQAQAAEAAADALKEITGGMQLPGMEEIL